MVLFEYRDVHDFVLLIFALHFRVGFISFLFIGFIRKKIFIGFNSEIYSEQMENLQPCTTIRTFLKQFSDFPWKSLEGNRSLDPLDSIRFRRVEDFCFRQGPA